MKPNLKDHIFFIQGSLESKAMRFCKSFGLPIDFPYKTKVLRKFWTKISGLFLFWNTIPKLRLFRNSKNKSEYKSNIRNGNSRKFFQMHCLIGKGPGICKDCKNKVQNPDNLFYRNLAKTCETFGPVEKISTCIG